MRKWSYWFVDPQLPSPDGVVLFVGLFCLFTIIFGFVSGDITITQESKVATESGTIAITKEEQEDLHEQVRINKKEELRRSRLERSREEGGYFCVLNEQGNEECTWVARGGE